MRESPGSRQDLRVTGSESNSNHRCTVTHFLMTLCVLRHSIETEMECFDKNTHFCGLIGTNIVPFVVKVR